MDASERDQPLPGLTGLRFFAAAAVVLYHADPLYSGWPEAMKRAAHSGYAAVALFYVLSGFVLTWNYGEAFASGTARAADFFIARLARVYPLYFVGVAWAFVLLVLAAWPLSTLLLPTAASVLALQSWYPPWVWLGNVPGWSIGDELFFYLAYPLLAARVLGAATARRAWLVLGAAWLSSFVPIAVLLWLGRADSEFVRFSPLCRFPEFVAGMALGRLFVLERREVQPRKGTALVIAGLAGVLGATWFEPSTVYPLFHNGLLVPFYAALVLGLARGGGPRWLDARPLVFLGEISFGLYLLQEPLKQTLNRVVLYEGTRAEVWAGHLVFFGSLLACAALAHLVIEKPARRRIRALGSRGLWGALAGGVAVLAAAGLASLQAPLPKVVVASGFQRQLGCEADWSPDCLRTQLEPLHTGGQLIYRARFPLPAGEWEYKVALEQSWRENYGAHAAPGGANLKATLAAPAEVEFLYSPETHWVTSSATTPIVTLAGTHQSQLGCLATWELDCLATWMQDPDGDGRYTFTTGALRAGRYEAKAVVNHAWASLTGKNQVFEVPADGARVELTWDSSTGLLTAQPPPTR